MQNNRALFLGGEFFKMNGKNGGNNGHLAEKSLTLEPTLIAQELNFIEKNLGRYPTINLSLSEIKNIPSFDYFLKMFEELISNVYAEHEYLLNEIKNLSAKKLFKAILAKKLQDYVKDSVMY